MLAAPRRRLGILAGILLAAIAAALALLLSGADDDFATPAEPAAEYNENAANVVVVMTDDQAIDTMRALPRTRRLIGGEGVAFDAAISTFPLCCPARATFLTGQYAHNNGVLSNQPPRGGYDALDSENSLPVWLSEAGYRTGFVGKYLNHYGKGERVREVPPGWSDWHAEPSKANKRWFDYELNENGKLVHYGDAERDYKTDVLADKAVSFVRESSERPRPFFLWVATGAPHLGAKSDGEERDAPDPAPRDEGRFEGVKAPRPPSFNARDSGKPGFVKGQRRLNPGEIARIDRDYVGSLESLVAVDRLVERIVTELRRQDELDDTLIVFTTDHGFMRGQHRIDSGKSVIYEEAIRIPLLIRGPGFPAGSSDRRVIGNIDLAPTIVELTGAEAGVEMDGRSLLPYDRDEGRDRAVLLEVFERRKGDLAGLRTPRYAYAEYEKGDVELYDLERDPHQLDNVAERSRYADARARLAEQTARLRDCSGAECR